MQPHPNVRVTGSLRLREVRGERNYYARVKVVAADGEVLKDTLKLIGPVHEGPGKPRGGRFDQAAAIEAMAVLKPRVVEETLAERADRPSGVTFRRATEDFLVTVRRDRGAKRSTLDDYRSAIARHFLPTFGDEPLDGITPEAVEAWHRGIRAGERRLSDGRLRPLSNRTKNKLATILHGIFAFARDEYGTPEVNPAKELKRLREKRPDAIDALSAEEVFALARAAECERDAAIFVTAALSGLRRGEVLALRWRDVNFSKSALRVRASYSHGEEDSTKSGRDRTVPMAREIARALDALSRRERFTDHDDLVFPRADGAYLDPDGVSDRCAEAQDRAGIRRRRDGSRFRFHDLRHTFGTRVIERASPLQVQKWLGHADFKTTERYLHHRDQEDDAKLIDEAFAMDAPSEVVELSSAAA